jgi:RHS repeat-associated protein
MAWEKSLEASAFRRGSNHQFDLANRLTKKTEKSSNGTLREFFYTYDQKSRLKTETDEYGNITTYHYDLSERPTETLYPDGALISSKYNSAGDEIEKTDSEGHTTHIAYNSWKKVAHIIYPDGSQEQMVHNLDGSLRESIDALGVRTRYSRDALQQATRKETLSAKGELLAVESYIYNGTLLTRHTDAEGTITTIQYDGAGRKIQEQSADHSIEFAYDELDRLQRKTEGNLIALFTYDLANRLLEERSNGRLIQYQWDGAGNQSAITRFVNNQPHTERSTFDDFHRLIQKTDPLGHITTIEYRKNQKIETDPLGLQTTDIFDSRNRLSLREKKKEGETLFKEELFYDCNGRKSLHKCADSTIRWKYDSRGRLERLIEGDGLKVTHYTYTPRGELQQLRKPNGVTLDYTYNDLSQLVLLTSSDGTVHHEMSYTRKGDLLTFDGIRRQLDPFGRVLSERFPQGVCVETNYDHRGRKNLSRLNGVEIRYSYGPQDLQTITCAGLTHRYAEYDLAGTPHVEELIGNLGQLHYTLDGLSRTTNIQAPGYTQTIQEFDAVGNILRMEERGTERSFTYDSLYQLTSESGPFPHAYAYDALYNRIQRDKESYQINTLNQRVGEAYDLNGNLIAFAGLHFTYDALDRLIRIEGKEFTKRFVYDYENRCLSQMIGTEKRHFLYDGLNEVGSLNTRGELQELRVLGTIKHAEIGAAVAIWLQEEWYAPIHSLQGNLTALLPLKNSAQPTHIDYSAFQEERSDGPARCPWRFSSKRTDPETGFVNYGRRYYLPQWGRWLNCDPLGYTAGLNLYAFVGNDPLTIFDEYGLLEEQRGAVYTAFAAGYHSLSSRCLDRGRFFCSLPYYCESGINLVSGRETYWTQGWQDSQSRFFNAVEGAVHSVVPIDKSDERYQTYRSRCETTLMVADFTRTGAALCGKGAKSFFAAATKEGGHGRTVNAQSVAEKLSTKTLPNVSERFTKNNYRNNLKKFTGVYPSKEVHAHHVFPQKYRKDMLQRGINVDDPRYLTWWKGTDHLPKASEYDAEWKRFFNRYPEAGVEQVMQKGKEIMSQHGIDVYY